MLSLKTLPYLHRPHHRHPLGLRARSLSSAFTPRSSPPIMAAAVEHVVLFKVKESADPSKIDAMISNLNALTSLGIATHLSAGPVHRARSGPAARVTHLLHSRYRSKPDLSAYATHPGHVAVVNDYVKPICDEILAVDWLADLGGRDAIPPGSALRLTLAKLKPQSATETVLETISEAGKRVSGLVQLSYGENFSPARAQGYGLGFITVFGSAADLEALDDGSDGSLEAEKEKVRPLLESVIVLDYLVPALAPASL